MTWRCCTRDPHVSFGLRLDFSRCWWRRTMTDFCSLTTAWIYVFNIPFIFRLEKNSVALLIVSSCSSRVTYHLPVFRPKRHFGHYQSGSFRYSWALIIYSRAYLTHGNAMNATKWSEFLFKSRKVVTMSTVGYLLKTCIKREKVLKYLPQLKGFRERLDLFRVMWLYLYFMYSMCFLCTLNVPVPIVLLIHLNKTWKCFNSVEISAGILIS